MKWYCGLTLCVLASLAAGDFDCFKNSEQACEFEWFDKHGFDDFTFCKSYRPSVQCKLDAAIKCKTGFDDAARQTINVMTQVCTEGTPFNIALKNDPKCGIDDLSNTAECQAGLTEELDKLPNKDDFTVSSRIRCKWFDYIKNCMYKKYESQCTNDAKFVLHNIFDSIVKLEKSICTIIPAA